MNQTSADNLLQLPVGGIDPNNPPPGIIDLTGPKAPKESKDSSSAVAPWPLIDRYPTIIGSGLSLAYLSSVYRLALTGYRREYVDALSELLERDPHLYAVLMQRVLTASGARIVLLPRDAGNKKCRQLAEKYQKIIDSIQGFRQSLATLVFSGLYYGLGGCEIDWEPTVRKTRKGYKAGWIPKKLGFIHSRRLNFPDPGSWDLRIWDQGQVQPTDKNIGWGPTTRMFGLRIQDYPGKFIIFSPQLHADYPTREGAGRIVAFWSALKTMGARGAAQYVERYAKPWALAKYATTSTGIPRAAEASAQNNDVGAANAALMALGTGSLAGAVVPDSIKIELKQITGSRSNIGHKDWIQICNMELSKGVLGQTDTTDGGGGGGGSRARASVMKTGSDQIARHDVMLIADCFQIGLIDWIARYNDPESFDQRPILSLAVDPEPDPYGVVKLASMFAGAGAPVDADEIARTIGVRLVDPGNKKARVLVPVKPIDAWSLHPDLFEQPKEILPSGGDGSSSPASPDGNGTSGKSEKDSEKDSEDDDDEEDDNEEDDTEDSDSESE